MYLKYNAVLRGLLFEYMRDTFESLCKGNRYTTTLHAMNSTVVKLSKLTTAEKKVYRGVSGGRLPEACRVPNEFGVKGGVEAGFMHAAALCLVPRTERTISDSFHHSGTYQPAGPPRRT